MRLVAEGECVLAVGHHAVDDVRCLWVVARVQAAVPRHQLVDGHALRVAAAVDLEDWRVRRQVAALGPAVSQPFSQLLPHS